MDRFKKILLLEIAPVTSRLIILATMTSFYLLIVDVQFKNSLEDPQVLGLLLDIIGAYYLSQSFMYKGTKDIAAESYGTAYPPNGYPGTMGSNIFNSYSRQSSEARMGFAILTAGFFAQIVGVIYPEVNFTALASFIYVAFVLLVSQLLVICLNTSKQLEEREKSADAELSRKYKQ